MVMPEHLRQGLDASLVLRLTPVEHKPTVVIQTPTVFLFTCSCGINGPLRPSQELAAGDMTQHIERTRPMAAPARWEHTFEDPVNVLMIHHGIPGYPVVTVKSGHHGMPPVQTNVTEPGHCRIQILATDPMLESIFPLTVTVEDVTG